MMRTLSRTASPTRCTPRPRVALSESSSQEGREPPHARGGRAAASVAFDKTTILGLEGDTSDVFFFFFAVTRQKLRPSQIREVPFVITGHQLWRPLCADVSGLPRMHGHVRCCLAGLQSSLQAGKPLNWPVQMSCQSSNTPDAGVLIKQVHEMVGERTKSFLLL